MLEYLFVLFIIILVIAILYRFSKHLIPVRQEIVYGILGLSFFLGAIFPLALSLFSPGQIIIIYFGLLILSGSALSYANNRFSFSVITAPVKVVDLEKDEAQAKQLHEPFETILQQEILNNQDNESSQNPLNEQAAEIPIDSLTLSEPSPIVNSGECTAEQVLTTAARQEFQEKEKKEEELLIKTPCIKEMKPADENSNLQDETPVSHCISNAFKAKASGDMAEALISFYKALSMSHDKKVKSALALEISAAYQELGQYTQAGMILRSILEQESIVSDITLRNMLQSQLIYLETLAELAIKAGMPNVPYSKMPNLIKLKANVDFNKKLDNLQTDTHLN